MHENFEWHCRGRVFHLRDAAFVQRERSYNGARISFRERLESHLQSPWNGALLRHGCHVDCLGMYAKTWITAMQELVAH